ncbi:MAG: integrase arm-type DNA-binding domain-containing protein [Steroidobacteraceae bacterium]
MSELTETAIRAAKPTHKPYKRFDGQGLYLLVMPTGGRLWRFKFRSGGKEKLLSLGSYPDVSLKQARAKRDAMRSEVANGADPAARRKSEKLSDADSFEALAREWLEGQRHAFTVSTFQKAERLFERAIYPYLGAKPIKVIDAPAILEVLRRLETRGLNETAHRAKQRCGQVFRYAVATGRASRDPTADLRDALAPVVVTNHAAITDPSGVRDLLRAIDGYQGQPAVNAALKLAPYVFVRPGELRKADWCEFSLDGADPEWRIPAARMKMRDAHVVPLSRQAVAILKDLQPLTGPDGLVFPSITSAVRPISENTLNAALRRLGYPKEQMSSHGFRTLASTNLNEQGFHPDLIELQLAHKERNKVRAAYNKATRLAERRKMMQAWADFLDALKASNNVVAIKRRA